MTLMRGKDVTVVFDEEPTFGDPPADPAAGTAEVFPLAESQGSNLNRPPIEDPIIRSDANPRRSRLGSRSAPGSYSSALIVGALDRLLAAGIRANWVAAVQITETEMTSITTTTNTIVAAAGSWITEGVRVGDIVRLSNHQTAANNDRNLRVTAVTASTITVAETLTTDASADTAFTLTVARKVARTGTPVDKSWHVEQRYFGIDRSHLIPGLRIGGFNISGSPDGAAAITFNTLAQNMTALESGASPFYTNEVTPGGTSLVFADASIRLGGTDIVIASSFELGVALNPSAFPVIGSDATPDVFVDDISFTGQVTVGREDLEFYKDFDAETGFELHVLLTEPESEPKDFISLFLPNVGFSEFGGGGLGGSGGVIDTLSIDPGVKESTSGYDETSIMLATSAA